MYLDCTLVGSDDSLANHQAHTESFMILLRRPVQLAEHLKDLAKFRFLDPLTSVCYDNFKLVLVAVEGCIDIYVPRMLREFERVPD